MQQHHSKVLLRGTRATLLVHDIGACYHDLHSDDDGELHAHLGGGGGDDWEVRTLALDLSKGVSRHGKQHTLAKRGRQAIGQTSLDAVDR